MYSWFEANKVASWGPSGVYFSWYTDTSKIFISKINFGGLGSLVFEMAIFEVSRNRFCLGVVVASESWNGSPAVKALKPL